MTSRLAILRSRLVSLRWARASLRAIAAWSTFGSSLIIALLSVFVLDFAFRLAVPERIVVLGLALASLGWAFWRFTWPMLGPRESEMDLALLVERQHRIDSDLIAALQFESKPTRWGSPQLTEAVVDYVAAASPTINVFHGLDRRQMLRRFGLFAVSLALALLLLFLLPRHAAAFINRLTLGSMHYPTRTRIEAIYVNRTPVFGDSSQGNSPTDCKAAQGRPLTFLVACSGQLPPTASVILTADKASQDRTRLELRPLSLNDRLARLREAADRVSDALRVGSANISPIFIEHLRSLIAVDAPEAVVPLITARETKDLQPIATAIAAVVDHWPTDRTQTSLLAGELPRLGDDLRFHVNAGDATTDRAHVYMIPLPIVEVRITPTLPKYASRRVRDGDASGRQLAMPEGSSVELVVACTNRKPLASVALTLHGLQGTQRLDLVPTDATRCLWSPKEANTPLTDIRRELRYEVQVVDADGLSLEAPIRGTIRIRPDEPPVAVAEVIHKVVLPTASPIVNYRATDDYGIARIAVLIEIERAASQTAPGQLTNTDATAADDRLGAPATAAPSESHRFNVLTTDQPLTGDQLPVAGTYALALSPLKLAKGDRLKLTLEVTDFRGDNDQGQPTGQPARSDSLVLEISDESGVLAAISQADQRSEQQLTEIIKRQLGIGEESK